MAVNSATNATGNLGLSTALANQTAAAQRVATDNASTGTASSRLNANFDTFLTLLTTQLRNQNPLDPLNTEQFTQQITSFSGVEQQIRTNTLLNNLVNNQTSGSLTSALSFLGNDVVASGNSAELSNGLAQWTLNSPSNVGATITITNATGQVVRTEQRSLQAGTNSYQWNGRNDSGQTQASGTYKIAIAATSSDGTTQTVSTQARGRVTGIDQSSGEPVLTVGGNRVKLADVISVSIPGG